MIRHQGMWAVGAALLVLAGCSGGKAPDAPAGTDAPAAAPTAHAASDWGNDACVTFPMAKAAEVTGLALAKAKETGMTAQNGVHVSTCTYATAHSRQVFTVVLRNNPAGGTTIDEEIAGVTSQPEITGPGEPVAMPRGKAVWVPRFSTLTWVPQAERLISVTPWGVLPSDGATPEEMKARALKIAAAIGG